MNEPMSANQPHHSYERDEVIQIINSVISKVEHAGDGSKNQIFTELKSLQKIIEDARAEIGSMRPAEINDTHIPSATDELDAIVESTAEATGTIMDACEAIQEKASAAGETGNDIINETMKIFEACSFQDITGQRITKVVKTLKDIERKVDSLMSIMSATLPGGGGSSKPISATAPVAKTNSGEVNEEDLLNGPQLPGNGITQDDIDKLLEQFD